MSDTLPLYINPWLLYRHHEVVNGRLPLAEMPNLLSSQLQQEGDVEVHFSVIKRDDDKVVLIGKATADLRLECQRCLQPFEQTFAVDIELVLVRYDRERALLDEADDAIVCEEKLALVPLVEQELILALPMIAKHEHCQTAYENTAANKVPERQHPFANLKDLLN